MSQMTIHARALTYKRQKEQSAAIRLLHADNAPVFLAVVAEHFPRGAEPRPTGSTVIRTHGGGWALKGGSMPTSLPTVREEESPTPSDTTTDSQPDPTQATQGTEVPE